MAESSLSSSSSRNGVNRSLNDQLDNNNNNNGRSPTRNRDKKNNDLDSMSSRRDSTGRSIPAWKLREQMKRNDTRHVSTHTPRTRSRNSSSSFGGGGSSGDFPDNNTTTSSSLAAGTAAASSKPPPVVSRTPGSLGANRSSFNKSSGHGSLGATRHGSRGGDIDPSLPPAFRAAFARQQQRKREMNNDDFMSLDSVHSGKSGSYVTGTPTTARNDDDDESSSLGSESLDGHDSFASLGEDSDDDEAYRESKNMLARQEVEQQRKTTKGSKSRIKRAATGVHGTPLDFIAE